MERQLILDNGKVCSFCFGPLAVRRYKRATGSQVFCRQEHLRDWEASKRLDHSFVQRRNVKDWRRA